jgi:hypothetical protein
LRLIAVATVGILFVALAIERWTAAPAVGNDGPGFHECVARLDQIQPGMPVTEVERLVALAEEQKTPRWAGSAPEVPASSNHQELDPFCLRFIDRCPYAMSAAEGLRCSLTMWRYGANHIRYEVTFANEHVVAVQRSDCYTGSDTTDCPAE